MSRCAIDPSSPPAGTPFMALTRPAILPPKEVPMPNPLSSSRAVQEEALTRSLLACGHRLFHATPNSRGQARILKLLTEEGPMGQRELQQRLDIQAGSVSELINKMEARGWITRERDAQDRRRMRLSLTKAGEAAYAHHANDTDIPVRYGKLTDAELNTLVALLDKIIEGWKEEGVPMCRTSGKA